MKFRLIDELDISSLQGHTNRFDDDSYAGILYYVKAQKSGGVITEGVMGRIRVNYNGDDIVNAPHTDLRKYCDLLYGKPKNETAGITGDPSYYGAFIPFYHPSLPNAIHKEPGENLDFYIEAAQESVDSATCYVYGVIDDVPEVYVPRLISLTGTAATGTQKLLIDFPNIASVMLTEPEFSEPTLVQLLINNELIYSGSWQILEDFSNVMARIEATALDVIYLDIVQKGQISEALNDEATLLITGGSGSFNYLINSLKFNPAKTVRTATKVTSLRNAKLRIKGTKNPGVQIAVIHNPIDKMDDVKENVRRELEKTAPTLAPLPTSPSIFRPTTGDAF